MKVALSAVLYFAIVFGVGFLLGPVRVFWLEPWLGKTIAVLCEMPFLLLAMVLAARWIPWKLRLGRGLGSMIAMGLGALLLQQVADFAVSAGLRGIPITEQLAYLRTPAGLIYLAALAAFAAMPAVVNWGPRAHLP